MRTIDDCRYHLVKAGIAMPDADQLRRIAMTLHRWHELECGDSNAHSSWCLVRGNLKGGIFTYNDDGKPFIERHYHSQDKPCYTYLDDRERGAQKRLAKIMARYPGFVAYVQGDPRGASLYIVPADVQDVEANYTRGIAVYK